MAKQRYPNLRWVIKHNKAFKSDSQCLAFSLRSSIAKRRSHLNAALCFFAKKKWQFFISFQ
ncbi:hypothetical protein EIB86_24275 [Vibrio parahaemolyticus]|nr:hypothetical protein [Vibrio parahaemolyticus]